MNNKVRIIIIVMMALPMVITSSHSAVDLSQDNCCYQETGYFSWSNWHGHAYSSSKNGYHERFYNIVVPDLNTGSGTQRISVTYPWVYTTQLGGTVASQCNATVPFRIYHNRQCDYGTGVHFEIPDICRGRKVKFARVCYYNHPQEFYGDISSNANTWL